MNEKPVLFIPAYNEAHFLPDFLNEVSQAQKQGAIGHVLIVDDGSTDNTGEVAKEIARARALDARIVRFEKNQGKGAGLYFAIKYFFKKFPNPSQRQALVMLDADIKCKKGLNELIGRLTGPIGKQKKTNKKTLSNKQIVYTTDMVVGSIGYYAHSGQRAFRLKALKPILARPILGLRILHAGYGLELELNQLFSKSIYLHGPEADKRIRIIPINITAAPASSNPNRKGRTFADGQRLNNDLFYTGDFLGARNRQARALQKKRITDKEGLQLKISSPRIKSAQTLTQPTLPKTRRIL